MAKSNRAILKKADCFITAVAMDEKFLIIGKEDGKVAAYWWNGGIFFKDQKISETSITAVACEENDEGNSHIFYAGDSTGMIYTLDRRGVVIAEGQGRNEEIHTLFAKPHELGSLTAYSTTGLSRFKNAHKEIKVSEHSTNSAQYSLDGDGTFYQDQTGQYLVNKYNCLAPTTAIATCRLQLKDNNDFAWAVVDPEYLDSLDTAEGNDLPVYNNDDKLIRTLQFKAPVIQVMSRRYWGAFKADEIYFLLRNGDIVMMKGTKIENKNIENDDLQEELDFDDETFPDDHDEDDEDDEDPSIGIGFAVHGSSKGTKIIFKGTKAIAALSLKK